LKPITLPLTFGRKTVDNMAIDVVEIHAPPIPCSILNNISNGNDGVIADRKDAEENNAKP